MKRIILILMLPILRFVYWVSGFFPRRKNLWIFGSYVNSFTDNSKYLYIYILENHSDIDAIWLTSDKSIINHIRMAGGDAHHRWSPMGIYYALRGKYWFVSAYVSDINHYFSRGCCLINLWHGIPLKKIEFDIEQGPLAQRFQKPTFFEKYLFHVNLFRKPEWVLSTSEYVTDTSLATAFRVPKSCCIPFGYPRLDIFHWSSSRRTAWVERWGTPSLLLLMEKMAQYKRVYIYMPTWRDSNPNFLANANWNFIELNKTLRKLGVLLVLKLHVATPSENLKTARELSNIHIMDSRDDIYPVLPETAGLITDYSSIYLDYLVVDRPICFFAFDLDRYLAESRGFYHSFNDCTPGIKVATAQGVIDFIISNSDDYELERIKLRRKMFKYEDGQASRRIMDFVKTLY